MTVLTGCDSPAPDAALKTHVHPNGLQLSVSDIYQVSATPAGFRIEPLPPGNTLRRSPIQVSIRLLDAQPQDIGYRFRYLGAGRFLWYTQTHDEPGGSSGANYTLIAFERVGNRWIEYQQQKLMEYPVFELWEFAQGLRYLPAS